ncbi:MAG: HAD family hydrolase [Pseudomonadales bacterium]
MARNPIRLITFDLDNTLWPVTETIVRADATMRRWLDAQVPGFSDQFQQEHFMALRQRLIAADPALQHDLSKMRVAVLTAALQTFGKTAAEAADTAASAFRIFIDGRHDVRYFEGVEQTLAELARDYTLAALTNGNADFGRLSIGKHMSFGFSSASVGVSKPHPDIFHAALKHAGVAAHEAVHIGDHPMDDIHGAAAVGMRTILVRMEDLATPEADAAAHAPDAQITALSELAGVIAALEG